MRNAPTKEPPPLYKVITCNTTEEMDTRASSLMEEGWEPLGGVSCTIAPRGRDNAYLWSQSFTRRKSPR